MEEILRYFTNMTEKQKHQFDSLFALYQNWNSKINLISRRDFDNFYEHHILHSLAIAKIINFKNDTEILDVGTGGGFPGIPLSILFPKVHFTLVDSIGKKIKVVADIIQQLKLTNAEAIQIRAEQMQRSFDFAVSRAVTTLPAFCNIVNYKIRKKSYNDLPNGIFYLKGGDLKNEIEATGRNIQIFPISTFFHAPFFKEKYVVYIKYNK